jgi:M6 family metalloprotease-like protein
MSKPPYTHRMPLRKFLIVFTALILPIQSAFAVPHIKPGAYPNRKKDMIHRPTQAQMKRFGSPRNAIIGGASGSKNVAVIITRFPASSNISGSNLILNAINIDSYFTAFSNYYNEVSNGNLTLTFRFFGSGTPGLTPLGSATAVAAGSYLMANSEDYYGCGDEGTCSQVSSPTPGLISANGNYLIRDALLAARAATTGPTSSNSGGTFDAVLVLHAGNGNETTSSAGDIWSIFYSQDAIIAGGGGGFTEGAAFPETELGISSPLGVMCHEFGHELGLPDLYNTESGQTAVGYWDLMDFGAYSGSGANPSHMGAWDKYFLGWSTPTVVSGGQTTTSLGFVENTTPTQILKLPVGGPTSEEFFLVEYRSETSGAAYDRSLPGHGQGLLIWHIDDAIARGRGVGSSNTVNSGSPHKGVAVVPANGVEVGGSNFGTASDPFTNGQLFTDPLSNTWAGDPSGVGILNISGVGTGTASMTVFASSVTTSVNIVKAVNYPNPAGPRYVHPRGNGMTTIQFQLSRPAHEYSINIYTLSGDLVKKIPQADIRTDCNGRSTCISDYKFVYEYDWDLKNADGRHVAPGVYLYLIRADGEKRTEKMVVIR